MPRRRAETPPMLILVCRASRDSPAACRFSQAIRRGSHADDALSCRRRCGRRRRRRGRKALREATQGGYVMRFIAASLSIVALRHDGGVYQTHFSMEAPLAIRQFIDAFLLRYRLFPFSRMRASRRRRCRRRASASRRCFGTCFIDDGFWRRRFI